MKNEHVEIRENQLISHQVIMGCLERVLGTFVASYEQI